MSAYIVKRLGLAVLSIWGILTVVFFMTKLIPGDAARIAAGRTATAEQVAQARERLGLDLPVAEQYVRFLGKALTGDLGDSASTHQSVAGDLANTLPVTLQLVIVTMLITVAIAVPLGMVAASNRGRSADIAARTIFVLGGGVPVFWLAILLQWMLAANLGLFPVSGSNSFGMAPPTVTGANLVDSIIAGDPAAFADSLAHLLLPALALSAPFMSTVARNVRSNLIGAMETDYIGFAVAKGASPGRVLSHHAMRATFGSTLTIIGMQLGWMMGAALLVESVFALPGLGVYLTTAVGNQDTFAVLGCVLVIGVVFTVAGLVVDLIQMTLDPRVRASHLTGAS
ncbi:ABC transporter permease [Agromyces sp. PvR057]|uniref:ABC transporter permease n=1 Tax=Agromyces sp. PvR057 TaxID=3156403 RepID=UPI000E21C90B